MNIYGAVILDEREGIVDTWSCYADNIREAKRLFNEDYIILDTTRYKVLFRLIKEN